MDVVILSRTLFAICLLLSWLNSAVHILQPSEMVYSRGIQFSIHSKRRFYLIVMGSVLYVLLLLAFVFQWFELLACFGIIGLIAAIRHFEINQWEGDVVTRLGKYSPAGTVLFAYALGYAIALVVGPFDPVAVGWEAACGGMGAAWWLAAWKKWKYSGFDWMSSNTIGLLIAERVYIGSRPLRALRRWAVRHGSLLFVMGFCGLFVEAAGIVFLFPDYRWGYVVACELLLAATGLFLGYFEPEWMLIMPALALGSL